MKKIVPLLFLVFCTGAHAAATPAQETNESGFFGTIAVGGGISGGKPSQLEVTDDNRRISGLNQRAGSHWEAMPVIMAEIGYAFAGSGTDLSLKNRSDLGSFELSFGQSLGSFGAMELTADYAREEVWKDPYLVDIRRKATDETTFGLALAYEEILGTGARLSIRNEWVDVDDDEIGRRVGDLRRDGSKFSADIGYCLPLNENQFLVPRIGMVMDNRHGESESSRGYELQLDHFLNFGKVTAMTSLAFDGIAFDAVHPVFHRTREEKWYMIGEHITYAEPFGLERYSLHFLTTYNASNANIDFFDSDGGMVGMAVEYRF